MSDREFWKKMGFILASEVRIKIIDKLLKDSILIQKILSKSLETDKVTISNNLKALIMKDIIEIINPEQRKGKIYRINKEFGNNQQKIEKIINLINIEDF